MLIQEIPTLPEKWSEKRTRIYVLWGTEDGVIRYVGRTRRSTRDRLREHACGNLGVSDWVRDNPGRVGISVIEFVSSGGRPNARERYWITWFYSHGNILNKSIGGYMDGRIRRKGTW